ncbi:hypothetical protein ILYODFUR_006591 [Ilyodon furcidens]|uniref:Uncharacterized protein n=1 Tax=Ilyodon furcidens TaxID=33524 RepID=A0ABV0U383_9TELE
MSNSKFIQVGNQQCFAAPYILNYAQTDSPVPESAAWYGRHVRLRTSPCVINRSSLLTGINRQYLFEAA